MIYTSRLRVISPTALRPSYTYIPALLPPPSQDTLPATTYRPYRQADTDFFLKYLMLQTHSPTQHLAP
jgi:hypothetical protein